MNDIFSTIDRCRYVKAYSLEDNTWGGRMINNFSGQNFPWFKGHEPLYCIGTNGNGIELFFDLGGASVSGAIYERVMTGRNVEVLSAMPVVVRDTFFMACELFPDLRSSVVLQLKSEPMCKALKNTIGFLYNDQELGFCIIMDRAISRVKALNRKIEYFKRTMGGSFLIFQGLFDGVPEGLFEKFPEIFVAMVFAHELGHVMQIITDYHYDFEVYNQDRKKTHLATMGYISPAKAMEAGVRGEQLLEIQRKYRESPFESVPDKFAVEVFTKNFEYFARYMRDKCTSEK